MVAGHKGPPAAGLNKGGAAGADASRGHAAAAPSPRRSPRSAGWSSAVARWSGGGWNTSHNGRSRHCSRRRWRRVPVLTRMRTRCIAYRRLEPWGDAPERVCHRRGEDARDDGRDGLHEVHVTPMEGLWSLLRSWLRPHRGISQGPLAAILGLLGVCPQRPTTGPRVMGIAVGARAHVAPWNPS